MILESPVQYVLKPQQEGGGIVGCLPPSLFMKSLTFFQETILVKILRVDSNGHTAMDYNKFSFTTKYHY